MSIDVHIGRVALTGRVRRDAAGWRARLDALAGSRLAGALGGRVASLLERLGLRPEAEVLVRSVRTRVRVRGAVDDARLAGAWAESLARDLEQQVAALAAQGGGWDDAVAVFEDASAASLTWVAERLRGAAPSWWEARVAAGRAPGEALADVAFADPGRLPVALARMHARRRVAWEVVVTGAEAEVILGLLERAWRVSLARAGAERSVSASFRSEADALATGASQTLAGVELPALRRLLAMCIVLSGHASASGNASRDGAREVDVAALPAATRASAPTGEAPTSASDALASGSPPESDVRSDPDAPPRGPDAGSERRVDPAFHGEPEQEDAFPLFLGGLAFLVAPLLRSRWTAAVPEDQWPALVHAVIEAALTRLLAPLSAEHADLVRAQHAGLLAALTGDASPLEGEVGERALDEILGSLPADLLDVLDGGPLPSERRLLATQLRSRDGSTLGRLLLRPTRLQMGRGWVDLHFPLPTVDLALRLAGWDLDPGWVACLGRVIRFHYVEVT